MAAAVGIHSATSDSYQIEVFRRAYIIQRRADGKPDSQIISEIRQIDQQWQIDLILSDGDLIASTKPYQLIRRDSCKTMTARTSSRMSSECQDRRTAQRAKLRAAGIEIE